MKVFILYIMRHLYDLIYFFIFFLPLLFMHPAVAAASDSQEELKKNLASRFAGIKPVYWGENAKGVRNHIATGGKKQIALTLDACGSANGKGFDSALIAFLEQEQIPATLFINARWIDANPEVFKKLAHNPLFEIANHGALHKPASVNGKSAYGIKGTTSVPELVDEILNNIIKIEKLTGKRPAWYRSGTAYYDDVAVQVANALGQEVAGYSILGDAGATFTAQQVTESLLNSKNGDIILCHFNHPNSGTAAGIKAAIPQLKRGGFNFVRLSDYPIK